MRHVAIITFEAMNIADAEAQIEAISEAVTEPIVLDTHPLSMRSSDGPLAAAERERIALADAWRAQMTEQGIHPTTAALIVQDTIDRARLPL